MKSYAIQLTVESPLAIRADHSPESAGTAQYISGQTLIGGLTAVHRLLHPDDKETFEQLFLGEQVLYSNLYPAVFKEEKARNGRAVNEARKAQAQDIKLPVYPLPRTAQSCKRHPGFRFSKDSENDAHGVRDSLIDWALFKLKDVRNHTDPIASLQVHEKCICKQRMNRFEGYYRRFSPKEMMQVHINEYMRLQTHTGIDRASGTVQEGILYNRVVFEEGTRFWGSVQFPDEKLADPFARFIQAIGERGLLRIGTGRTRGMGRVKIEIGPEVQRSFTEFERRLDDLNTQIGEQARKDKLGALDDRYFFALTLHAPVIISDEFLRYRGTIDEKVLSELLRDLSGDEAPELRRIYQSASVRRVTGWQELWGLPRTNEYAIDNGSVFLFESANPSSDAKKQLLQALFRLEEQGIGKRRREGFGRVCVSDQFHQEVELI